MTDQPEPTPSSRWLSLLHSDLPAQGFRLEPWQRAMAESFQQAITERRLVHRTAPIRRRKYVSVRCTLKLTSSLTLQDMEYLYSELSYIARTPPAIRALVSSLMREYRPWFSFVNIETRVD